MADAFTQEIIRSKLLAITGEMGTILARTSMSPIVYEVLDFACGLTDATGAVVAQDNGLCLFTGTFQPQVASILEKFPASSMQPGDIYMTNSPYGGGTHNPDIALIMPIFFDERLIAFGISVTHWTELGGKVLGSIAPDSTEIYQEGLQFPRLQLYTAGEINRAIIDIIEANVRLPLMSIGDLNAGVAAVRVAERRVREMVQRYRTDVVLESFEAIMRHGEEMARRALETIPQGVFEASDFIDGDGITEDSIPIQVKVTIDGERFVADFTGTAGQTAGAINCSRGALLSACKTVFKAIIGPQLDSNEGLFRPFELVAPDGTVFTAVRPAPTGWYYEASANATELIWKALAPVLPQSLSAGSYLSLCAYYIGGQHADGRYWLLTTPQDGGWGACADQDGESSLIATTDGDTYNYPAEVIETAFPLTMLSNAFNTGNPAGHGRYRGGFGTVREYRIDAPNGGTLMASMGRSVTPPWGVDGGSGGATNYYEVERPDGSRERGGRTSNVELGMGDIVRIVTGNGGGWGKPSERDPAAIARDLADQLISREDVAQVYGGGPA
ncbi:MAG TPA: hydantoinase B/oxoprolinase family protein [Thermomicrobiales bacterium]|nr:hydantoinase B/oxoprolinase family protein [Thermomicrobiales bacterium]